MGIIKRQAYSGTMLTYSGVIIGFVSTALIFPKYLTTPEIGLLNVFLSYAYIFAQLATLGTGRITIYTFPIFRDRAKSHHGFFPMMMIIAAVGLLLALAVLFLIKPWLISNANDKSPLFGQYFNYLYPLVIFALLFQVMDSFNTTLFNAVRGIFLREFFQRLIILLAVVCYALTWITFPQFTLFFVLAVGIPAFILVFYLIKNDDFVLRPAFSPLIREQGRLMANIGLNGVIIGFSGMVILNIDRIMVERIMGLGPTGIYTTMAYFATLVAIPSRALLKISDPIIAQSWKDNNLEGLRDNYYRSSLNQFLIGCLLLAGIWGNIGNILQILPPAFSDGKWVILFIGLAFLADMMTGTATFILANSKYYRYQTYYILILVGLIILTNYLLIPVWGLTGAAVATLISKLLTNIIRHQILYRKFGLQPYNANFLKTLLIAVIAYLAQYFIPVISNLYMDIAVRSLIIGLVFMTLAIAMKISPEVNMRLNSLKENIVRKFLP